MRKLLSVVALLGAAYLGIKLLAAQARAQRPAPRPIGAEERVHVDRLDALWMNQELELLAAKYGLDAGTAGRVITSYDAALGPYPGYLPYPAVRTTPELLSALSNEFGVPIPILAAVLLDRELFNGCTDRTIESATADEEPR